MDLIRALRLDQTKRRPRVAFVGAGGKSTAIFQLARQLAGPVFVSATTHLALGQIDDADQHFIVNDELLDHLDKELPQGLTLLTGPLNRSENRTMGVSNNQINRIDSLAELHQIPLLIEADGSRQMGLKAPGLHEPPIPDFVDLVVVVAGLSSLGKPLTSDWVHRPEVFSALCGLHLGEIITPEAIAMVLTHPKGGLKNIPSKACRIALLNQADRAELQAAVSTQQTSLLQHYEATLICSLKPPSSIYAVHQPISAVILAAGASRRFGEPKQLLDWHGKPLIWHVAQKALQARLSPVVVVCGSQVDAIQKALVDLPVEVVFNPDWQQGQGISVRLGVQKVTSRSSGILFLLSDQPHVPVALIRTLVEAHARSLNPITGPMVDGQRANPVLFDQATFDDLVELSAEKGGRQLFGKFPVDWIPWYDPAVLFDIDHPEDYLRLLEMDA